MLKHVSENHKLCLWPQINEEDYLKLIRRSLTILQSKNTEGGRSLLTKAQHMARKLINSKSTWVNGFFSADWKYRSWRIGYWQWDWAKKIYYIHLLSLNWAIHKTYSPCLWPFGKLMARFVPLRCYLVPSTINSWKVDT